LSDKLFNLYLLNIIFFIYKSSKIGKVLYRSQQKTSQLLKEKVSKGR